MEFFKILDSLKEQYKDDMTIRKNETILLSPGEVPRAKHMLYKPLEKRIIDSFLVSQYTHRFPRSYLEFLSYSNGADLCTVKMWHNIKDKRKRIKRIPTACGLFTIFGLPRTQPYGRPPEMEEPFDMRIEDLARHKDIPNEWLKCGTYYRNYDFRAHRTDIFIDTRDEKVYACVKNQKEILESWNNLDECFCSVYHHFDDRKEEYEFI